jgi:hypothetical protein
VAVVRHESFQDFQVFSDTDGGFKQETGSSDDLSAFERKGDAWAFKLLRGQKNFSSMGPALELIEGKNQAEGHKILLGEQRNKRPTVNAEGSVEDPMDPASARSIEKIEETTI